MFFPYEVRVGITSSRKTCTALCFLDFTKPFKTYHRLCFSSERPTAARTYVNPLDTVTQLQKKTCGNRLVTMLSACQYLYYLYHFDKIESVCFCYSVTVQIKQFSPPISSVLHLIPSLSVSLWTSITSSLTVRNRDSECQPCSSFPLSTYSTHKESGKGIQQDDSRYNRGSSWTIRTP